MDFLTPPPPILPNEVWHADVLRFFGWYITVAFAVSLIMRWRLYTAFYRIAVFFARISDSRLLCDGSRCWTRIKAMPVSAGTAPRSSVTASRPPAEAPSPTTKNVLP